MHNFRPIAFFVSWSESSSQVTLMMKKLQDFLSENFNFELKPQYILTDNSDALITGCKKAFGHDYIHLGCHFHIAKRLREKAMSKGMKEKKQILFFGLKALKNSPTLEFFKEIWKIIKKYWQDEEISKELIQSFENEYIKKPVQWHYGTAFPGKSRTNNSLESGNNIIKNFFDKKSQNIKEFFCKMRDFVTEWSTLEKTSFPNQITYLSKIRKDAEERAKEENFMFSERTPELLYYPRKGVTSEKLTLALTKLLQRKEFPSNFQELYEGWSYFRIVDPILKKCDCGDYFKYSYCKHTLAIQILEGEVGDPEIQEKKKRGRKANITKALMK